MPSGERSLIWDTVNKKIVFYGWGKYKPEELQGIINLRQWQMNRSNLATLGGVLYTALHHQKITEDELKEYQRKARNQRVSELAKLKKNRYHCSLPMFGINPESGKPVAEEIGRIVLVTNPQTGGTKLEYRVSNPKELVDAIHIQH